MGGGGLGTGVSDILEQPSFDLPPQDALEPMPAEPLCQLAFKGMKDSQDPQVVPPEYAKLLQNCYPLDSATGSRVIGRPGFTRIGAQIGVLASGFSNGFSSGFGGGRRVQGIHQYTKLNGTEITIVVAGGKFYHYTWATDTFAEQTISAATLAAAGTVYMVTMANVVIVSDGTNTPFKWDGSSDTVLSNCPVLYGQPTVYYAKLFGIKNTERSTIVWSEEADPTTGYEAGGYNNAWTLGQTDQDPLFAIRGTNEALYYWREHSIGAIRGKVDSDFINSGTREGVSETVGTGSPDGVQASGDYIHFVDATNRPRALSILGGRLAGDAWKDVRETTVDWDMTKTDQIRAVYDPETNLVLLGGVADSSNNCNRYIAIDADTLDVAGLWLGWESTCMALVKDVNGDPVFLHGTDNGYVYRHGTPEGTIWQDTNSDSDGGLLPISHKVTGAYLGDHMYVDKKFVRWDVSVFAETDMDLTLYYKTPRGTSTSQSKTVDLSTFPTEYHIAVGLDGAGRWILPTIEHSAGSQRFGLERWCVRAVMYGQEPEIP